MSLEVVDLIHRLSYEVSGQESLQKVVANLQNQAEQIEIAKSRLANYNDELSKMDKGSAAAVALTKNIDRVTQAIDQGTAAIVRQYNASSPLQQALRDEVGLMQQLSQYIAQATKERATLTDVSQIRYYTENIKAAQAELASLVQPLNLLGNKQGAGAIQALQSRQSILTATIPTLPKEDIGKANQELEKIKTQLKDLQILGKEPIINIPQSGAIEALQFRITQLQNAIKTAPPDNKNGLIQYTSGGAKEYISSLNNELSKTQTQLKELQNAGKEPIINIRQVGAIEAVNNRLAILKNTLKTVPKEGIQAINIEIEKTQRQLSELNGIGTAQKGSVFSTIFGGGTAFGRQALQGILLGVGFGSGIGLISRAVSGLIEYAEAEFDAVGKAEKLKAANDALTSSFDNLIPSIEKAAEVQQKLIDEEITLRTGLDLTVAGYKAKEDALKSLGVLQGEIFEDEKRQFEAGQKTRLLEQQDLEKKSQTTNLIASVLEVAREKAGKSEVGFGTIESQRNLRRQQAEDAIAVINASNLTGQPKDDIVTALLKAKPSRLGTDEGSDILSVLEKELDKIKAARIDADNAVLAKRKESANAETKFIEDHNREIFAKEKSLRAELAQLDDKYQQERIKSQVTAAETIKASIAGETDFLLKKLAIEREDERKKLAPNGGALPDTLARQFDEKATAIQREQQLKQLVQLHNYYQAQLTELNNFQQEVLKAKDANLKQGLSEANPLDFTGNAAKQGEVLNNELSIQLAANSAKYSVEVANLEKLQSERRSRHEQETQDYKLTQERISTTFHEFATNEEDAVRAHNIKIIGEYADAYKILINQITNDQRSVVLAISAQTSESQLAALNNPFAFLNRSAGQRVIGLRGDIKAGEQTTLLDQTALQSAQERQRQADAARSNTTAGSPESEAAIKEQQAALDEVERLSKKITDAKKTAFQDKKEIQKIYVEQAISDFQSLADSAVKAYDIIAQARQKDLDREIQVRTERVNVALQLAERGNTQALAQEQKALEAANQERRRSALTQLEINAALTLSNATLAVVKALVEYGPIAGAIAGVGALVTVFAEARALSESNKATFATGGYTGDGGKYDEAGTVHRGEFVFTKETTEKHRELFEAIHKGYDPMPQMRPHEYTVTNTSFATKKDFQMLGEKLDIIASKQINVSQSMNRNGFVQIVEESRKDHANKYRA